MMGDYTLPVHRFPLSEKKKTNKILPPPPPTQGLIKRFPSIINNNVFFLLANSRQILNFNLYIGFFFHGKNDPN
jgi:hypothetical protein